MLMYRTYDIVVPYGVDYLQFQAWVGIWAAIMHWAIGIFNWSDYMKYVTDFSSTTFGVYVGIIYCVKGVEEVVAEFDNGMLDGYLSCIIAILFFLSAWSLTHVGSSQYFHYLVRSVLSDYALIFPTLFWTGFSHFPGPLSETPLQRVPITRAFYPTLDRAWFIPFWELEVEWIFVAIPFGALVTALFYYDHHVSSLLAQARHFPLRKPSGFHWDFFLLGWTTLVAAFLGLPFPNALIPQAVVHTESCAVIEYPKAKDVERPGVKAKPTIQKICEQRLTHLAMGLLLVGTMTGPVMRALGTMPRAVLAGVFIYVGWTGLETNPILLRTVGLLHFPIKLPTKRWQPLAIFLALQWICIAMTVAISQTIAAIGFPVLILALIPLRWTLVPRLISQEDLKRLDSLTADADIVLESLGGAPSGIRAAQQSDETLDESKPSREKKRGTTGIATRRKRASG